MWIYITALIFGLILLGVLMFLARRDGTKSARLEALKREIKERERASRILAGVQRFNNEEIKDKLKKTK